MDEEEIDFRTEAGDVIKDISFCVTQIFVSSKLPSDRECVYINIETRESKFYCVQLCIQGFRIVGDTFDNCSEEPASRFYETIYALLDNVSPGYSEQFGKELSRKLSQLQEEELKQAAP